MIEVLDKNEYILETAIALLQVRSLSGDNESLRDVLSVAREFLAAFPLYIHESEVDGVPALVATTRDTKCPAIMLQGHLDVVDGNDDQFQPRMDGDRLYARGAVDMKAFVAVAMHVLGALASEQNPPDVGLMITTDEEVGGALGAGRLVKEGWRTKLLINGDGGYGDAVSYAEKGIVQLELEARATPGQRYAPWDGESAAAILVNSLQRGLSMLCDEPATLSRESNWGTTSCILALNSESDGPMPPKNAHASVRMYWTREERGEEIINLARRVFAPLHVEGEVHAERVYLSPKDQRLLDLQSILQKHLRRPIGMKADNGASDAKWFAPLDVPIVLLRFPGEGAHTEDEWLERGAFEPLYNALLEFIRQQIAGMASDDAGSTNTFQNVKENGTST